MNNRALFRSLLAVCQALLFVALPVQAANYVFPGSLPAGCSGAGPVYSCSGLTLGYGDTVSIASPMPATINVNGNMSTNQSSINAAGSVGNLNLIVSGTLTTDYQANLNANVTAGVVNGGSANEVRFGGSLTATAGSLSLGFKNTVLGSVSSIGGNITAANEVVIGGSVSSTSGAVSLDYRSRVAGDVSTASTVFLDNEVEVGSCVRSTGSAAITLNYHSIAKGVCCGSGCSSACVVNNSAYSMPPPCAALSLSKTASTSTALTGDVVTFTVRASNAGGTPLGAFVVTDVLPAGMALSSAVPSAGSVNIAGQTITWTMPGLAPSASAQLTLAVSMVARGVYTNTATSPAAASASATVTVLPGAITHFRMDEAAGSWNGTAGEVRDSGGTGLHGTRIATTAPTSTNAIAPDPTIKSQYPAVLNDFCNAGSFDGNAVVRTGSSTRFDYANQFSASAWIYPTARPTGSNLYSILSNDQNYEFHIDSAGRLYWWWGGGARSLTSVSAISNGQWTHVAITLDSRAGVARQTIYINGVADATNNWQGTLSPNPCDFHLGGDVATNSCGLMSERNFRGRIDEAKMYDYELTAAEVRADMLNGRNCSSAGLDHIQIEHDGVASVCAPESVTVKACADASCASLYTGSVTTTLLPTGWVGGDSFSFSGGVATRQLSVSTTGSVVLRASSTTPAPATNSRCFLSNGTESCVLNFGGGSCNFDAVEVGANPRTRIYTKLANAAFDLDILALTGRGAVDTRYSGTVNVDLVDSSVTACPTGTGLNVPVSLRFRNSDDGRRSLAFSNFANAVASARVRITDSDGVASCSSDSFTIRPSTFSSITSSNANADDNGLNPSATPIVKAGASFSLTANTGRPGYNGLPKVDAGKVEWSNAPSGGQPTPGVGLLGGAFTSAASVVTGSGAFGNAFTYSDTGYFRFKAQGVYDDSFTAASGDAANGDCTNDFSLEPVDGRYGCKFGNTAVSNHFGRFIPDHFDTAVTQACVAGGFTYSGQPIPLTILARNTMGATTLNYAGGFAKQVTLTARDTADTASNPGPGAFSSNLIPASEFSSGIGPTTPPVYTFTSPQTAPTDVRIRAIDTDGVSSLRAAPATTVEGVTKLRSGRLRLQNANGSELLPLPLPFQIQYWSGSAKGWQRNDDDTCSQIRASDFAFDFPVHTGNNLTACETRMQIGGASPNFTGTVLSAPGVGNNGWANLTLNLGATAAGNQCTVGVAGTAATTANAPWLQFNWKGAVGNPESRATFGVYRSGRVIHRREMYR